MTGSVPVRRTVRSDTSVPAPTPWAGGRAGQALRRAAVVITVTALLAGSAITGPAAPSAAAGKTALADSAAPSAAAPAPALARPAPGAAAAAQTAPARPALPTVTAAGAVLWDSLDRRVLGGKQASTARPMASTTKIMTVLLALEAGADDETLTVSARAAEVGRSPGGATLGLREGQRVAVAELLAGLMLRSGNDAAVAVAEHVAGSEPAFTQRMNERAAELGLTDTRFVNASGLTDDLRHHASPRDLARLATVALRDESFARWAGAERLAIPGLGVLANRNELLGSYPGATGVKTGYTRLAGLCLVASARRGGRRLVAVVLNSDESFADAARLLDYGFSAFRRARPLARGATALRYRWAAAAVKVRARRALGWTLPTAQAATWRMVVAPDATLPVSRGQVLGRAELVVGGRVVDATELVAARDVPAPPAQGGAGGAGSAVQQALRAFARVAPVDRST